MQSSQSLAIAKSEVGIDAKSHLSFDSFLLVRSEVAACSFNPSGELSEVINIGVGVASNLTQGCVVLDVLPEVFNGLGSKQIRRDVANDCRNENSRPTGLKCE